MLKILLRALFVIVLIPFILLGIAAGVAAFGIGLKVASELLSWVLGKHPTVKS